MCRGSGRLGCGGSGRVGCMGRTVGLGVCGERYCRVWGERSGRV